MKKIVLIGGGHTHLETIQRLGERSFAHDYKLILISSEVHTPYSGMVPGLISGHYKSNECHIDLQKLCGKYDYEFVQQTVLKISSNEQTIHTESGTYQYDLASINTGSTPNSKTIAGLEDYAIPIKPIKGLVNNIQNLLDRIGRAPKNSTHRISVVGGGAASIEVLLALQYQATTRGYTNLQLCLITAATDILETHALPVKRKFHRILHQRGITTYYNAPVIEVNKDYLKTGSKKIIPSDFVIWATGASPSHWPKLSGLPTTEDGYIKTDNFLQVKDINNLFATGDIASIEGLTYPKSGVYAVKQARILEANIRSKLSGAPLQSYTPQKSSLALISTGDKNAVASKHILCASGRWIWKWKDHVDRKFVKKFQ